MLGTKQLYIVEKAAEFQAAILIETHWATVAIPSTMRVTNIWCRAIYQNHSLQKVRFFHEGTTHLPFKKGSQGIALGSGSGVSI